MSVREWCTANGVNVNTYYGCAAALKKDNLKQNRLPVQEIVPLSTVQDQPDVSNAAIIVPAAVSSHRKPVLAKGRVILRKDGIEIVIPPDISEDRILLLFRGLKKC